jgi:magnesium transporter
VVVAWRGDALAAACIASSVLASMIVACLLGVLVPTVSRAMRLDPKIAAGPLTLALADICTLSLYFGTATLVLG